jgi:hypothetical protein
VTTQVGSRERRARRRLGVAAPRKEALLQHQTKKLARQQRIHVFLHSALEFVRPCGAWLLTQLALRSCGFCHRVSRMPANARRRVRAGPQRSLDSIALRWQRRRGRCARALANAPVRRRRCGDFQFENGTGFRGNGIAHKGS